MQFRASSHGVPSHTHISKSQHGGKVPTSEPQETIKIQLIIIKSCFDYLMPKITRFVLRFGSRLVFAQPNSQHKSQASPPKIVAMYASMSYLGPM